MNDEIHTLMLDGINNILTRLTALDARLGAVEEHLRDMDTLAERREKHRLTVARSRRKLRDVTSHENVMSQKEKGKGKETFPPAPPIEKRESPEKIEEEEGARAGVKAPATREESIAMVSAYNAEIGGNIDAEYFVDYYGEELPKNWRGRLRNWLKHDKSVGRIRPDAPRATSDEKKRRLALAEAMLKASKEVCSC